MSVPFISSEKLKQFLNQVDIDDVVEEVYKLIDVVLEGIFHHMLVNLRSCGLWLFFLVGS